MSGIFLWAKTKNKRQQMLTNEYKPLKMAC
jgi:hypothetical protein